MNNFIGVFDSGIGGVSVLKELKKIMPNYNYYYLSDSKNMPYGGKEESELKTIIDQNIKHLISKGIKLIVIACNTATSIYIDEARRKYKDIIFVGIEPAIKVVYDNKIDEVLVLATYNTLNNKRVNNLLNKYNVKKMIKYPCIGLADLIEKKDMKSIDYYFLYHFKEFKNIKSVLLGCTHYSLIKTKFEEYFKDAKIIDGNMGISNVVKKYVEKIGLKEGNSEIIFEDTSNDDNKYKLFYDILNN